MNITDPWDSGLTYEPFMGRWSRLVAQLFIEWLRPKARLRWSDAGCGTGALSALIAHQTRPRQLLGIDPSAAFIAHAIRVLGLVSHLQFQVASAGAIPVAHGYFDIAVSALALNFFPDPSAGLREMQRVVQLGQPVAVCVWDCADGLQMLRHFWDAVIAIDSSAVSLDEKGFGFPSAGRPVCGSRK